MLCGSQIVEHTYYNVVIKMTKDNWTLYVELHKDEIILSESSHIQQ